MKVALVLPHQLFDHNPCIEGVDTVYLVEEDLYFNQFAFNKKKLLLHRASMKYYANLMQERGRKVVYIDAQEKTSAILNLLGHLKSNGVEEIHYCDTTDFLIEKRITNASAAAGIHIHRYSTPQFINRMDAVSDYFDRKGKYFQTDFYVDQRKRQNILIDKNGKPSGGKWSFDAENRKKYPRGNTPPAISLPDNQEFVPDAVAYVEKHYARNYGTTLPPFDKRAGFFPVTHREAQNWLTQFLEQRFALFGTYEDAMVAAEPVLYHSVLTPMLNTGLLTPDEVLSQALDAADVFNIPLNSLEGFIRQILGWREFIRIVYEREGVKQRRTNFWEFEKKIPESFWNGTTGIDPVDIVINKSVGNAYSHHIERLMVMGNFMLLCEFHPDEVYNWFMTVYIDAYDWVMVPNTYGMTQYADGGLITTKPYISGSNYLMKMGNWKKGAWQETWDALFWRFMTVHEDVMGANPRIGMLIRNFEKRPKTERQELLKKADAFLDSVG